MSNFLSHRIGKLTLEATGTAWLFNANDDFYGGQRLTQEHLLVIKSHAIYTFRPGLWLGLGVGYGQGAATRVDGVVSNTLQTNWRFDGTLAYAVAPQRGLSVTVLSGVTTRVGEDFNSFGFVYQYLW